MSGRRCRSATPHCPPSWHEPGPRPLTSRGGNQSSERPRPDRACKSDECRTDCEKVDISRTEPAGQTLESELRVLVRLGLPEARPDLLPRLFDLRCVRQEVRGDAADDSLLALEHALKEAVSLLGAGDRADAARALLGLDPRTRSFKRPRRREAAKNFLLGPGYDTQTFRRRYEEALISDVAYALHKLESHVRLGFPLT